MSKQALHRAILGAGLGGTSAFVLAGTWFLVSRVWAESFTRTLEVLVATPFLALWVLAPVFWVARPKRASGPEATDDSVTLVADGLLVAVGAGVYIWSFVVLPVFLDLALEAESLLVVLIVPALQWAIVGASGMVRWARDARTRR